MNLSHKKLLQILKGRFSVSDVVMIHGKHYPIRIIKAVCSEIKRLKIDYNFYTEQDIIKLNYDHGVFNIRSISSSDAKRVMVYIGGEDG